MGRQFKYLLIALAFASAISTTNYTYAQTSQPTATPPSISTTNSSGTPSSISISTTNDISSTSGITASTEGVISPTTSISESSATVFLPTPTVTPPSNREDTASETSVDSEPLQGTIIANRSEQIARFFLEGETYQLAVGRSQGINLPRATTVLNLFNCAGDLAVNTQGCFWDPYLINQDGFFEIYDASLGSAQAKLMLREAGTPPSGQVWVQNRTGQTESVVFKEEVFEIQPTSIEEFSVAPSAPAILYVRSCLRIDNQTACEWAPKTLEAGIYYAMLEADTPGSLAGSTLTNIVLRPVVGEGQEAAASEVISTPSIVCNVVVPALNVRSGPGLQYDIIGKVRSTDGTAVIIRVTGRSADREWLTVDPTVAENGWINNSPSFITCSGDLTSLPIIDAPLPPTPQPITVQAPAVADPGQSQEPAPDQEEAAPVEDATSQPVSEAEQGTEIPLGQSLLIVNNGFQYEMRFTLDQSYRPLDGPSEFDLQPGASISIIVFPGDVPFTASSPWSGLSSNATVRVEPDQSLSLWLRFELEQGGSWKFAWN